MYTDIAPTFLRHRCTLLVAAVMLWVVSGFCEQPLPVESVRLLANARGLALELSMGTGVEPQCQSSIKTTNKGFLAALHFTNVRWTGEEEVSVTGLPESIIRCIIRPRRDRNALDIALETTLPMRPSPLIRHKDSILVILLSSTPFPSFSWSSKKSAAGVAARSSSAAAAELTDMGVLQRGAVAQLWFEFTSSVVPQVSREGQLLTLGFAATGTRLSLSRVVTPHERFKAVSFKRSGKAGAGALGVGITLDSLAGPVSVRTEGLRVYVMAAARQELRFVSWSLSSQRTIDNDFEQTIQQALQGQQPSGVRSAQTKAAVQGKLSTVSGAVLATGGSETVNEEDGARGAAGGLDEDVVLGGVVPLQGGGSESAAQTRTVQYRTYGRDPFVPFARDGAGELPAVENIELVGIMADSNDKLAMFEDRANRQRAFIMRERDPVRNGSVWRIEATSVIFLITEYGLSRTYTLRLNRDSTAVTYR